MRHIAVLVALIGATGWTAFAIITAILDGRGHGSVFWTAIALLTFILAALCRATWRRARTFASRVAKPS
jgi:predicted dehydrogenase